jgi:hypothetical protein
MVPRSISRVYNFCGTLLLVTANSYTSTLRVFMLMELGTEQPLSFLGSGIERKPALVVIVEDTRRVDAGGCKPSLHSCHSILGRGEHFVDFICGPVLPVFWRRRIRTEPPLAGFFHNIFAFCKPCIIHYLEPWGNCSLTFL